jgi:hypothetical protein
MKQKRKEFPGVIPDDGSRPYCNVCKTTVAAFKYRPGLKVQDGWHASVLEYDGEDVLVIRCHGQKWVMRRDLGGRWFVDAVSPDQKSVISAVVPGTSPATNRRRRIASFVFRSRRKTKPVPTE